MTDTSTEQPPPPYPKRGAQGDRARPAGSAWRLGLVVGGVVALGVLTRPSIVVVILALVVMIFLHELGHYLVAKRTGMKVTEFFIGFGPRIWSFYRGETEYGLKAIPAGAYVRIIGMSNLEEVPPEEEHRTYRQQSYPRRMAVAFAGSAMHFIIAFLCIFTMLAITGTPAGTVLDLEKMEAAHEARPWVVGDVAPGSAAALAGLQPGDRIASLDGEPVRGWEGVRELVRPRAGEVVPIVVERDGARHVLAVTIGDRDGAGFLGIGPEFTDELERQRVNPAVALVQSGYELALGLNLVVGALADFVTGGIDDFARQVVAGGEVADPGPAAGGAGNAGAAEQGENRLISIVGATRLGADLTDIGLTGFLFFLVNINLFIGIFNLIPLLPLDGGHVAIGTYERLRSRKGRRHMADLTRLMPLTYAVVAVLILLAVSTLYLDIVDPITLG